MCERGTQNGALHVWGNWLLAKLLHLKYFLDHMGSVRLTDMGCAYRRGPRRSGPMMGDFGRDGAVAGRAEGGSFALFMAAVERGLRMVEPVSFSRCVGVSKTGSDKGRGIMYGLRFLWLMLRA